MREVLLDGAGLALSAASVLLRRAGWQVHCLANERPTLPTVLLNEASQRLIRDIFGGSVLSSLHRIHRRYVRWGCETKMLPHSALVAQEQDLLVPPLSADGVPLAEPRYTLRSTRSKMLTIGERWAESAAILLRPDAPSNACWVEAVPAGWLFGVTTGHRSGTLLGVGGSLDELLATSTLLSEVVLDLSPERKRFSASPRLALNLSGPNWLACGGGAIAFDPICGEGVGHALREAILASAILRADAANSDWSTLQSLYEARLRAGFRRHLEQCLSLYSSGGGSPWWQAQQADLVAALRELPSSPPASPRYRLVNFDLIPA